MSREGICSQEKIYRVTFDGGNSGFYTVDFCENCYLQEDKKWITRVEVIQN